MNIGGTKHVNDLQRTFWFRFPELLCDDIEDRHNEIIVVCRNAVLNYFKHDRAKKADKTYEDGLNAMQDFVQEKFMFSNSENDFFLKELSEQMQLKKQELLDHAHVKLSR